MKYLKIFSPPIKIKIDAWKKHNAEQEELHKLMFEESKKNVEILVNFLDIIDEDEIEFLPRISTKERIYYKISHSTDGIDDLYHICGGDTLIQIKYKKDIDTKPYYYSLWNFTANILSAKIEDFEGVALILDYLIKKYPEIWKNLPALTDAKKFGL